MLGDGAMLSGVLLFCRMAAGAAYFYECNITLKDHLVAIIRDQDRETDLCRGVSMLLQSIFNLRAVRRLSSHSGPLIVTSIVYTSPNSMCTLLKEEVESLIKVYIRGWIEGLGCGIDEDLHMQWLNEVKVHFFSC
ncbi:E4 ORF2 [Canine adenovirus 2]|uniref:E4 ORF2 n=3 Tax=Canine mastadenovirus A TaxID=10537 RepID=P87571_ADECT|nr:E4 ORF2 [Canine adenovirus 2]QJS39043.1 E4 ORF2 [Canine adenovirus 2]UZP80976.1 E4 ORF2 [Canine adenovirus 2]